MLKELIRNISTLFAESKKLATKDINGTDTIGFFNLNGIKLICIFFSSLILLIKGTGFESGFLEFVTSYLSILIGLFITALIFSFDKFYEPKDEDELKKIDINAKLRIWDTQAYNYTKKFAFITSQTIVISIFVLILIAIENLFLSLSQFDIWDNKLVKSISEIDLQSVIICLKNTAIILERFLVLYWLLNIMINTLYIVSSMVDYMIKKNDRK